ncbi:MAG: M20/M25/M40 family metallo-hydrolase [Actinomycetota bacterium]|nr:M20/M25/M40 family metallo-hydrolase [Actinomycetota bacterium]
MDWDRLGNEAVEVLSEYIRIDTTNPPGNEARGAEFLGDLLEREGIDFKTYESEPGRTSLVARLRGGGEGKPLILLNHIDVVPAEAEKWDVHPFSGQVSDGYIWGRGTLDMKGMGIMELMAMFAAAREGLELKRDVVFLAVADEEAGGSKGCGYLMQHHPGELEADMVLNEGGFANTTLVPGHPLFMVSGGEKYVMWLRLTRKGVGGHGSMPTGQGALESLVLALARLLSSERPMRFCGTTRGFFSVLAGHWDMLKPFREDGDVETLKRLIVENNLAALPALNSIVRNTISLNVLHSGVKMNVIPDEAMAELDCRVLPDTEPEEFLAWVREALDDPEIDMELVIGGDLSPESPPEGALYSALERAITDNYPDAVISPFLMPAVSDSRFFRRAGVPVYGIIPAHLDMEALATIHGLNERIAVEDVRNGVTFIYELVRNICT